jgi:signal transduction histidine kinase
MEFLSSNPLGSVAFAFAGGALCVGTLVMRYHSLHASPEREQVMWALMAFLLLVGAQIIGQPLRLLLFSSIPLDAPTLARVPTATGGLVLLVGGFACLAVALLRDELTQLELVFNRTLVYTILTLLVICVYGATVGALSLFFQATGSYWFSLIATGLVAVLFQPLREWVQRLVNQLLYGQRDEPVRVLAHLGERLEEVQSADALLPELAKTIAQTLKLPYVAIAIYQAGELVPIAEFTTIPVEYGSRPAYPLTIPLIHQRETLGELRIAPRSPDAPFAANERELLMNIARQAGAAVRAVQLTTDLQQSRQRLVSVVEEERRRLRRDLHDGLGPVLAALILQSETAHDLVRQDPAEAENLLISMADQAEAATQEIRRLVYDLRPPALDDLGLMGALHAYAHRYSTSGVQFEIRAPEPLLPLPAAVEVAVYRIVTEAITNVIRHAHATHCWITLEVAPARLILTVRDNGRGLPVSDQVGVGVLSMRERCVELGGSFTLDGQHGTQIQATLPY